VGSPAAAKSVALYKMNGAGNDFVVLDERPPRDLDYQALARAFCQRTGELGADGLLVVLAPQAGAGVAATMRIFNADGSEAQMCGNGLRCIARYLWERREVGSRFKVATKSGVVGITVEAGPPFSARVDMAEPRIVRRFAEGASLSAAGENWRYAEVTTGNRHVVLFVEDVDAVDLEAVGATIAADALFAGGVNVHVAQVVTGGAEGDALAVRHYERGVGLTQACGSGAVAAAVAAIDDGRITSPVAARVPGGTLTVDWKPGARAFLEGPAEFEFERDVAL
jgi:diaminopimelate epimerase